MATTSREKKRVRVTCKPKSCPNPLFEKWLKELKDEAARKDSKLQYVYTKALKSLQKYPLVLESAKECKVLQHFGDGLCKILEKKLADHLAQGGTLEINPTTLVTSEDECSPPPAKVPRSAASQSNPTRKSREYIPVRRSGAYALLLALHKHAGSEGFLKKKELQELAQPYADVSFTEIDIPNRQYYGAWSAMKTLINKELVIKSGNPAKYELTESGEILAQKLEEAESELNGSSVPSNLPKTNFPSSEGQVTESIVPVIRKIKRGTRTKASSEVTELPQRLGDTEELQVLKHIQSPMKSNEIFRSEEPLLPVKPKRKGVAKASSRLNERPQTCVNSVETLQTTKPPEKPHRLVEPADLIVLEDDEFDQYPQKTLFSNSDQQRNNDVIEEQVLPVITEENNIEADEPYVGLRDMITLRPGEYEVVLCVDIAEVSGSSGSGRNQKETAAKSFQNCGVTTDVRKLSVGDYLWICKPKPGLGIDASHELVLPYVIERKRLDDLVSSIKDGRFKEQKFRLKHSGLPRPIYLIEEHGNRQNLGLPEDSVMQAVSNTLIIERFQVHWTRKSDESVNFLVQMTKELNELYRGKTVTSRACQDKVEADWQTRLVTFKELYTNSTKCKPLSVTMMFAKQLIQLSGLSGDKAQAIIKKYPTPTALIDALKAAGASADTLLAPIEYGKSKKKIGTTVSGHLARLYTQERFAT